MTIKETQRKLVRKRFTMQELQRGMYPSVSLIEDQVYKYFEAKRAGLPRFTKQEIKPHQPSSASMYNEMMTEIKEDLVVGFAEIKTLNNQLMALSNYYESNRIKIERELQNLEMKSNSLMELSSSSTYQEVIGDQINDFLLVNFKEDKERNIPKTDAFVDLRYGEVMLDQMKNTLVRHDVSDAIISFKNITENTTVLHMASIDNAFSDTISDSWRSVISSKVADGVAGELTIELKEAIHLTHLAIVAQTGKPVIGTLYLSETGENYVEYERRKLTSTYQWAFERQLVKFIRIKLEKREEDQVNGMDYEYIFGAKSIELKEQKFMSEATFVSKALPVEMHESIHSIQFEADDYTPPNTNIRYYVSLDYDDNMLEWQELRKAAPINLNMTRDASIDIDMFTDNYGTYLYTQFGNAFHRIVQLPFKPLPKTVKLMLGRNMWVKETLPAPKEATLEDLYQTSMRDWIRSSTARKEYLTVEKYSDALEKGMLHRYTSYIYLDAQRTYEGGIATTDEATHAIYINNNQIREVNDQYQFQFQEGWNKVQILTYARDQEQELVIDIYLRELTDRIYASNEPLTEVSMYDLLHNTSTRTHTRFAVDDNNNIMVNYDPKEKDIMRSGIEYSLSYRYSAVEQTKHKLRLMALLSKEDKDITSSPRLKSYKLIIE